MGATEIYLSLGANLGDRAGNLRQALVELNKHGVTIMRQSSFYETEPQDFEQQPWFLNIATACSTTMLPLELLTVTRGIERDLGRDRSAAAPKGPRLIDIDILLYGCAVIETPELIVPHPRMMERRFVLEPLAEIAPDLQVKGLRITEQLKKISGQAVRRI